MRVAPRTSTTSNHSKLRSERDAGDRGLDGIGDRLVRAADHFSLHIRLVSRHRTVPPVLQTAYVAFTRVEACSSERVASELNHVTGDLTGLELGIGLVDLIEAHATGDHEIELEQATHVEVDETRHIRAETVRAHGTSLDTLFAKDLGA